MKAPPWPSIQRVVRANNQVWRLLYYDELVDTAHYQLSHLTEADAGYYNCAQAVSRWDQTVRATVERFYTTRGLRPAVYVDPESPAHLASELARTGYCREPAERENWHGVALDSAPEEANPFVQRLESSDEASLDAFVELDAEVNRIPRTVAAKLRANLASRRQSGIAVHHFLIRVDDVPACCGSIGLVGDLAFLAEGATRPAHRRQGLYRRLTRARLQLARDCGARFAFFTAAPDSLSNRAGTSMGFSLRFSRDYWRLPTITRAAAVG